MNVHRIHLFMVIWWECWGARDRKRAIERISSERTDNERTNTWCVGASGRDEINISKAPATYTFISVYSFIYIKKRKIQTVQIYFHWMNEIWVEPFFIFSPLSLSRREWSRPSANCRLNWNLLSVFVSLDDCFTESGHKISVFAREREQEKDREIETAKIRLYKHGQAWL